MKWITVRQRWCQAREGKNYTLCNLHIGDRSHRELKDWPGNGPRCPECSRLRDAAVSKSKVEEINWRRDMQRMIREG